ncbi:26S proteasome non-ATPase regulatory subunit 1-like [Diaphorina citri]|uniref:26S proteasome non-ATPase regulatory subunit 1-like n=1 Tax=Diaphorina citri TaxID=121845 RepID=A0A3Q0J559_DIACI|nr:26S proteasome non-ATPase regulatory subunit 1-like [Diaphorina citri]
MTLHDDDDEEEALALLEPMTNDPVSFVRQGALIASAMILVQQTEALCPKLPLSSVDRVPEQCPSFVSPLADSYNPHVRYGAAMALGIACAGTGLKEALALLEPMTNDPVSFVRQGALIASAMILVQQTEALCPKVKDFRSLYSKVISDKHEDVLSKFGAILAQGIIDAGGRNVTISLQSRTGHTNMLSVVGTLLFTQYWYWFPLSHCLALAFTPTCLIGLNSDLKMPQMEFKSASKPSVFAYPPPLEEKKSVNECHCGMKWKRSGMKVKRVSLNGKICVTITPLVVIHEQHEQSINQYLFIPINFCFFHIPNFFFSYSNQFLLCFVSAFGPKPDDDKEPEPPEPFEYLED